MSAEIKPTADVYERANEAYCLALDSAPIKGMHAQANKAAVDVAYSAGYSDGYSEGAADGEATERARIVAALRAEAERFGESYDIGTYRSADAPTRMADRIERGEL